MCVCRTQSCPTLKETMDCSLPGSSVHGIFQEYWSGLSFPSPGDLLNPWIEPTSPELARVFFTTDFGNIVEMERRGRIQKIFLK